MHTQINQLDSHYVFFFLIFFFVAVTLLLFFFFFFLLKYNFCCYSLERLMQIMQQFAWNWKEIWKQCSMFFQRTCSRVYFWTLKEKLCYKEVMIGQTLLIVLLYKLPSFLPLHQDDNQNVNIIGKRGFFVLKTQKTPTFCTGFSISFFHLLNEKFSDSQL